jgi:hypothetical protein
MLRDTVQLGDPVEHRGIVVVPLYPRHDPVAQYITLDEALPRGLRISETSESGTVPELVVESPLAERVLLHDGEELVGANQNRILNVTVLVEAGSKLMIPVSCVEQGRWRRTSSAFQAGTNISHAHLRRRKAEMLAVEPLVRGVAQREVWDELQEKSIRMRVTSPTGAARDIYRQYDLDLRALEDAFPSQPGQCGAVFGLGTDLCLDFVSRPDAFVHLWPKLRSGYMLDALERLGGRPASAEQITAFVEELKSADATRKPSAGLGDDLRLRGPRSIGSGLVLGDESIQCSGFRSGDGGRRAFGRIARPSVRR